MARNSEPLAGARGAGIQWLTDLVPGLALALAVAVVARLVASYTPLPSVFFALLAGMLMGPLVARARLAPGIAFGGREVLRIGVALLGAQITLGQLAGLGPIPFVIAVVVVCVGLGAGYAIARGLRLPIELAWLSAGAVAICGASATLAIAAILPRSKTLDENAAATVAGITVIGTAAMLAYPYLVAALGFGGEAAGVFLGASLHEVVHAVGAGFSISQEAGETAATVKLMRVACLAPVILAIGWASKRMEVHEEARPPLVPWFLAAFLLLAGLASLGLFPPALLAVLAEASRLCLLVAIVALGTKVSLAQMIAFGPRPLIVLTIQSAMVAGVALLGILLLLAR